MRAGPVWLSLLSLGCGPAAVAAPTTATASPPERGAGPIGPPPERQPEPASRDRCLAEPLALEPKLSPRELDAEARVRVELASAVDDQGCLLPVVAGSPRQGQRLHAPAFECKFTVGRTYFEAMRWSQAAHWFRRAWVEHATDESAVFAAQLYLESLNVIATHARPPREACLQAIADDLPPMRCTLCAHSPANAEACRTLQRIGDELAQRSILPERPEPVCR
ncbi:MAG: hypothetical protein KF718_02805 [Polyangiaceae bacterium]|nr:hypothetical protein [Polyangiaceae bacterium]